MFPEPFEYASEPCDCAGCRWLRVQETRAKAPAPERSVRDEQGRMTDEYLDWLASLPVREEMTLEQRIKDAIIQALNDNNRERGSRSEFIRSATTAVMAVVRPYVEALERVSPAEAEALDSRH